LKNKFGHVGCEVLTTVVMRSPIFRDKTPCSALKVNLHFGWKYSLHFQGRRRRQTWNQCESRWLYLQSAFTLVSCSAYSHTLKIESLYSIEISLDFQQNTRRYIPEERTLQIWIWSDHRWKFPSFLLTFLFCSSRII
jgi:hypothetical protein